MSQARKARSAIPPVLPLAVLALLGGLVLAACGRPTRDDAASTAPPLLETLGDLHRDIGTPVPAAQRYFDQGLRLAYGFNREAALRSFSEAQRLDPACAMCAWGQALVLGPSIDQAMAEEMAADATALADRALRLRDKARPADRELIDALARRYATPAPYDRGPLDLAYAEAMAGAVRRHPDDDDIATLYAESLMLLSPTPADGRIVATLERALLRNPDHIGAVHYYIHAIEASPDPQRAEPHADRLAALAPGAAHLVHMPAHIYLRTGRYHDATQSNLAAGRAHDAFLAVCCGSDEGDDSDDAAVMDGSDVDSDSDSGDAGGNAAKPPDLAAHYWHFAAMTAALHGSRAQAIEAAEQAARRADPARMQAQLSVQQFVVAPLFAQLRFGQWDAILAPANAPAALPYPRGVWHFARGMALLRQRKPAAAQRELRALQALAADRALQDPGLGDTNRAARVLEVAVSMLRGELALARGQRKPGLAALRAAVAAEERLHYTAPPDWPLPVRPYLGAALLDARQPNEAAAVYRQDLAQYPDNGWSLHGLARAQRALKQADAAEESERRFAAAWRWADVELAASRF